MRSLLITAAVVIAAIALGGCPNNRPKPVPGPQSALMQNTATSTRARDDIAAPSSSKRRPGASEISWFQG
ncbi:MAG TPA: hypothetical protein VGD47_08750, partial [Steroidobacteraceae bacterium]